MEIRGDRECRDCGTRWSYYDTGAVACPSCGSLVSVGVGDRHTHTDAPVDLDLSAHRRAIEEEGILTAAEELTGDLREYLRRRGFVDAGDLRDLDDTYLSAGELRHAVDARERLARSSGTEPTEAADVYLLDLLRGADAGERPPADRVPESMRAARGSAYATAVLDYRREVREWLDAESPEGRRTLERVGERAKRVRALDGDVPVTESEALVRAVRGVAEYLRDGEESALTAARDRLDGLE